MLVACNVKDFTCGTLSPHDPLPLVLKVRANRFPHSGCLGASHSSTPAPGRSNRGRLAAEVRCAHPIPLSPQGDSILGVSL
jgi:hypothetical protein